MIKTYINIYKDAIIVIIYKSVPYCNEMHKCQLDIRLFNISSTTEQSPEILRNMLIDFLAELEEMIDHHVCPVNRKLQPVAC